MMPRVVRGCVKMYVSSPLWVRSRLVGLGIARRQIAHGAYAAFSFLFFFRLFQGRSWSRLVAKLLNVS